MVAATAAMGQEVVVVAAGFFQGIGKDGQIGEAVLIVDGTGDLCQ
jgi:hypothetical protein